jgi:hypothetical protein
MDDAEQPSPELYRRASEKLRELADQTDYQISEATSLISPRVSNEWRLT